MDAYVYGNKPKEQYNTKNTTSKAQGAVGEKIEVSGVVLYQLSRPVDTPVGRVYSHLHVIEDASGNLYEYQGSTYFPKNCRIRLMATVKAYRRANAWRSMITIIKAPKSVV